MTTTVPQDVKQRVQERITSRDDMCDDIFGFVLEPKIRYDLKGRVAGQAFLYQNMIKINAYVLVNNVDDYIKQTIGHEYAHLIAHERFGRNIRPHGQEWRRVMTKLGLPANRCHSYEVQSARKTVKYQYSCHKCGRLMTLGKIRHKKIASGQSTYSHAGGCGGRLMYDHIRKEG